jgi:hypothetical protein
MPFAGPWQWWPEPDMSALRVVILFVLILSLLIAASLAFGGPLFVRTIRHKDGDVQRH